MKIKLKKSVLKEALKEVLDEQRKNRKATAMDDLWLSRGMDRRRIPDRDSGYDINPDDEDLSDVYRGEDTPNMPLLSRSDFEIDDYGYGR